MFGRTGKRLQEHVKDDNTWLRAFVCQYLDVGPENDLGDAQCITLRRSELTWKKEFITRSNARLRWSRSRYITHVPHHADISAIHALSDEALLTASTEYGIVARSYHFTGKVIKGFLDATGMHHGLGIGNPNAEFAPNVTVCVLASEGASAKIIWGRRDGSMAVTTHPHTMNGSRAAAKISTSDGENQHRAAVQAAAWVADGQACITVSADGRLKIWTLRRFACAWTSQRSTEASVMEPLVKVLDDLVHGHVVCATQRGDVIVYSGFDLASLHALGPEQPHVSSIRIPAPARATENGQTHEIHQMFLHDPSSENVTLLVSFSNSVVFYRYCINTSTGNISITPFGDASCGIVGCVYPVFEANTNESDYVIAGDHLGGIAVYDWMANRIHDRPVAPTRHVEVFPDAHVTAIAVNPLVTAVGSSKGTIRILDTITFELLKVFAAPTHSEARHILLKRHVLVAAVGNKILAAKADPVSGNGLKTKLKGKTKQPGDKKWQKQYEMLRDIAESRQDIDKAAAWERSTLGREREQVSHLNELGLNEREAVEYVLMLSREEEAREEEARRASQEEGVFEVDMDESGGYSSGSGPRRSSAASSPLVSPSLRPTASSSSSKPIGSPSRSNAKIQVSPRFHPEPMEAGGLPASPLSLDVAPIAMQQVADAQEEFPQITPPESSSPRRSTPPTNAWLKPLTTPPSSSPPTRQGAPPRASPSSSTARGDPSSHTTHRGSPPPKPRKTPPPGRKSPDIDWEAEIARISMVEDRELKFALELSLAEARSQQGG
ncbi:hypothetical protein OF83DRAFT_1086591 [Amylostereum chailletii]|nr:hypothetical protein OF83DRAFT_1086591 [Amylostereum chailletii]